MAAFLRNAASHSLTPPMARPRRVQTPEHPELAGTRPILVGIFDSGVVFPPEPARLALLHVDSCCVLRICGR